ncbi:MAG TPA: methyl-accepting chemotaxis protein [Bryobacteraceae bacterium]|nr:methyl-accepting chemotaxis protein [Bryobacteraceae bacterium]
MNAWSVRARLIAGFSLVVGLMIVALAFAVQRTSRLEFLAAISRESAEKSQFIAERRADHLAWVHGLETYLLDGDLFTGQLDPRKCRFGEWLYRELARTAPEDAIITRLLNDIEPWHRQLHESARRVFALQRGGNKEEARSAFRALTLPALGAITELFDKLRQHYGTVLEVRGGKAARDLAGQAQFTRTALVVLGIISLLFAAILSRSTVLGIARVLRNTADELKAASRQITGAAAELASSSQSLAQGASEQAALLEETSASAHEITALTTENADNVRCVSTLMNEAMPVVEQVNSSLNELGTTIAEMSDSSGRVSHIIRMIDEIAFQTNILALNAAVEAARAGEAGLGFAVVANEVRSLAQRCAEAASDIGTLIEDSVRNTAEGTRRLTAVTDAMAANNKLSVAVKERADHVSAGSAEQARGLDEVARAILKIEQITQTTAASAEQTAAASQQLNEQVGVMSGAVGRLQVLIGGRREIPDHRPGRPATAVPARPCTPAVRKPL